MALQLAALRDALIDAGASEAKADRAAEELAGYENRLASIDTRLAVRSARDYAAANNKGSSELVDGFRIRLPGQGGPPERTRCLTPRQASAPAGCD